MEGRRIQGFGGEACGKGPLRRPRCKWADSIEMNLLDVGWEVMDWVNVAWDRDRWRALVNAVMNLRVP